MSNLFYFLFALIILAVFSVLDLFSHQKFSRKASLIFHLIGIPVLGVSILILIIYEFKFSFFIYPGIILVILGLCVAYKGSAEIKKHFLRAKAVYTKGMYSKIRHPFYSGLILSLMGLSLAIYSLYFLIYAVVAVIMLFWMAYYEEKHLIKRFGKEYLNYKKETGMFLPKFKKAKNYN